MKYKPDVSSVAHCTSPPVCQNGGYVNANCQCTCPEGFSGVSCETIVTDPGNLNCYIIRYELQCKLMTF